MIFVIIALPCALLSAYLGFLTWKKNQVVSSLLFIFAGLNFVFALILTLCVLFASHELGWL